MFIYTSIAIFCPSMKSSCTKPHRVENSSLPLPSIQFPVSLPERATLTAVEMLTSVPPTLPQDSAPVSAVTPLFTSAPCRTASAWQYPPP